MHIAVGKLGHLLSLWVAAADEHDHEQVTKPSRNVQKQKDRLVALAFVAADASCDSETNHPVDDPLC